VVSWNDISYHLLIVSIVLANNLHLSLHGKVTEYMMQVTSSVKIGFIASVECRCCGFIVAKLELRLTLFYVCNEVVQTCRKKHAVVYKDAFKEILRDAALLVRLQ